MIPSVNVDRPERFSEPDPTNFTLPASSKALIKTAAGAAPLLKSPNECSDRPAQEGVVDILRVMLMDLKQVKSELHGVLDARGE